MNALKITPIALVASLMLSNAYGQAAPNLDTLNVTGIQKAPLTQTTLSGKELNQSRVKCNNTAAMLLNIPGVEYVYQRWRIWINIDSWLSG